MTVLSKEQLASLDEEKLTEQIGRLSAALKSEIQIPKDADKEALIDLYLRALPDDLVPVPAADVKQIKLLRTIRCTDGKNKLAPVKDQVLTIGDDITKKTADLLIKAGYAVLLK
jgi:hypothetical protein